MSDSLQSYLARRDPDPAVMTLFGPERLQSNYYLLNALSDAVLSVDRRSHISFANRAACQLLGRTREDLRGQDFAALLCDGPGDELPYQAVFSGDIVATSELCLRRPGSDRLHIVLTAIPVREGEREIDGALLVFRDITPGILLNWTLQERQELLEGIFERIPSGVLLINDRGRIMRINDAAREALGLGGCDVRDLLGRPLPPQAWQARDLAGAPIPEAPYARVLRTGEPAEEQACFFEAADRYMLVAARLLERPGSEAHVITTFTNIDRHFRTESNLHESIRINGAINHLLTQIITENGAENTMVTALSGAASLLEADCAALGIYEAEEGLLHFSHFSGGRSGGRPGDSTAAGGIVPFRVAVDHTPFGPAPGRNLIVLEADFAAAPLALTPLIEAGARTVLAAALWSDDRLAGVVYFHRTDAAAPFAENLRPHVNALAPVLSAALFKARYEARLNELATTDPLTGLWNRRAFFEQLQKEVERSSRYGTRFSVLMLDLDFFKEINDTCGHLAGDELLMHVAETLQRNTRKSDATARSGGEEFLILLPETNLEGAVRTAEKIRECIAALRVRFNSADLRITTSIGCAEHKSGESVTAFYARLDALLYQSKKLGRNRISQ